MAKAKEEVEKEADGPWGFGNEERKKQEALGFWLMLAQKWIFSRFCYFLLLYACVSALGFGLYQHKQIVIQVIPACLCGSKLQTKLLRPSSLGGGGKGKKGGGKGCADA